MSLPHQWIRDEFVIAFIQRRDTSWARRFVLIADRDKNGRAINREYGIFEPDGTVSAYSRSYDPKYKARFAEIDAEFQPQYDAVTHAERAANRREKMTIYEYLLLEEIQDKDLYLKTAVEGRCTDWLAIKAQDEIERIKHNSFSEIHRFITIKKNQFPFAAARCRKVLDIKPWDIVAQAAILQFGSALRQQQIRYLGSLRPARPSR